MNRRMNLGRVTLTLSFLVAFVLLMSGAVFA